MARGTMIRSRPLDPRVAQEMVDPRPLDLKEVKKAYPKTR